MSPRRLTTAVIAAAILLPVIGCLVAEATKDAEVAQNNKSPTVSYSSAKSAIFESSSPNSSASRPSVLGIPTTPGNVVPSTQPETKSFRELVSSKAYSDKVEETGSKVTKVNETNRDSIASRNDTPASVDVIWTTSSHAEVKLRYTETKQPNHSQADGAYLRSRPKVTSGSETGLRTTEHRKTTGSFSTVPDDVQAATTTDNYDYNDYNDDDDKDDDKSDESDEMTKDIGDADSRDDADGYSDRGDDSRTYDEDYRVGGGAMEPEDAEEERGGSYESKTEYLYVTDNFTSNDSLIDPENQGLQQDSNSDYDEYSPSSDESRDQSDNGQRFRGRVDYEAESRDYHLGVEHHNFDLRLGEEISEMRGGGGRHGQTISLRWLEHHPINHFTVFLWLVAALAFVSILMLVYRFRHSVINAMQCTKSNYKQGKRFGIEEANDLLSNAQV